MAHIRMAAFWAIRPIAALIAFLFSVVHLMPPSWATVPGTVDTPSRTITGQGLSSLIEDLSRSDQFDDRLREELNRLRGTRAANQILAQTAPQPQSIELAPVEELPRRGL